MKHTIAGKHGHLYRIPDRRDPLNLEWEKVCISRSEAASTDWMSMQLELRFKISRRWGVCWQCWKPTERWGGCKDPGCKKVLFFECEKCNPIARFKKKK